jgi:UMF1 family MFS transporter
MSAEKNKKGVLTAWCMYDWANSVYSLSISSAIFPIFFEKFAPKQTTFLGHNMASSVLYEYTLSFSFLLVALLAPILSGIADASGQKKSFMKVFVAIGSLACSAMYFFYGSNILFGLGCFMLATVGFAGSLVFYNSYLPDIATPDRFDRLSARGFTLGYIGSVTLLIINLMFLQKSEWFGMELPSAVNTLPFRVGFLAVGVWWAAWSLWPLIVLPRIPRTSQSNKGVFTKGFKELQVVRKKVIQMPELKTFLAAFFVYTMGVQTIIYVAAIYGSKQLELQSADLLKTILLIQLIGIAGAYLFAYLANKWGNRLAIITALCIWVVACIIAFYVQKGEPNQFFGLACVVGIVMGGIQSLSRSTYAKLIPGDVDNTSFFSFYEVAEKLAIVLGTLSFGLIDHLTGSMRNSILVLMTYFIIGIIIMYFVRSPKLQPAAKS